MIEGKKVLAVVPARGGSKGVILKNIRKVNGTPIVTLAAQIACGVEIIDKVIVSTDHKDIAKEAAKGGAEFPFYRPEKLSGDRISDLEVLTHALLAIEEKDNVKYDIIVMLQPTSPLRTEQHVEDAIKKLVEDDYDTVWTVSETESKSHPLKQLKIDNGLLEYFLPEGKKIIARQQLEPVYHRNGIAYAITRKCLIEKTSTKGDRTGVLVIEGDHVSIDTEWDFKLVEFILSN